jgi:hypothetical protein
MNLHVAFHFVFSVTVSSAIIPTPYPLAGVSVRHPKKAQG